MFQKVKQMCRKAKGFIQGVSTKVKMLALTLFSGTTAMAQSTAGDYSAGTTALSTVAEEIVKYVPVMVKLCYAIAGVVAIIGAISVYIAMNNEEQDVKKKIMMVVGACLFLIAAAQALPLFFGMKSKETRYPDYPLFKGLQRPLEVMGLQGRYIYWAAGTAGGAIAGFIAAYCLAGFVAGLAALTVILSVGIVLIIFKQRKGLHSKRTDRGVFVYAYSRKV